MKSILWFSTWACPYSCEYCWQQQEGLAPHGKLPDNWVDRYEGALNRLAPELLDISGGEPFVLPMDQLIPRIKTDTRIGFTTNVFYQDKIRKLASSVDNMRICSWTLSYHPTQLHTEGNKADFWDCVKFLKSRNYHVTVNVVGFPPHLKDLEGVKDLCRGSGAVFHFDPYFVPVGRKAPEYTPGEIDIIDRNRQKDRTPTHETSVVCTAGRSHLMVYPDGSAYSCLLEAQQGGDPLGNILDPCWNPPSTHIFCLRPKECAGCDRDKVVWTPGSTVGFERVLK